VGKFVSKIIKSQKGKRKGKGKEKRGNSSASALNFWWYLSMAPPAHSDALYCGSMDWDSRLQAAVEQ
jgi:hypothetical protein